MYRLQTMEELLDCESRYCSIFSYDNYCNTELIICKLNRPCNSSTEVVNTISLVHFTCFIKCFHDTCMSIYSVHAGGYRQTS